MSVRPRSGSDRSGRELSGLVAAQQVLLVLRLLVAVLPVVHPLVVLRVVRPLVVPPVVRPLEVLVVVHPQRLVGVPLVEVQVVMQAVHRLDILLLQRVRSDRSVRRVPPWVAALVALVVGQAVRMLGRSLLRLG